MAPSVHDGSIRSSYDYTGSGAVAPEPGLSLLLGAINPLDHSRAMLTASTLVCDLDLFLL